MRPASAGRRPDRLQDWQRIHRPPEAAETNHLAHDPPRVLHAEHQHLTACSPTTSPPATDRRPTSTLPRPGTRCSTPPSTAIDHAARFGSSTASYLTALLGNRPTTQPKRPHGTVL